MPRIFHVNWFRQKGGKFLWPGFCENIRVLDWICRRVAGDEGIGVDTPIGVVPKEGYYLLILSDCSRFYFLKLLRPVPPFARLIFSPVYYFPLRFHFRYRGISLFLRLEILFIYLPKQFNESSCHMLISYL